MAIIALAFFCPSCSKRNDSGTKAETVQSTSIKTSGKMKNLVSIVEIPTSSFPRAVKFYESLLDISIEEIDMQGTRMGLFPGDGEAVNVAIIHGADYKPSDHGTLAYLNGGADLQAVLDKVEPNGGKVIVPKTEISPEAGFFAMFLDSEGNKIGLHSYQ